MKIPKSRWGWWGVCRDYLWYSPRKIIWPYLTHCKKDPQRSPHFAEIPPDFHLEGAHVAGCRPALATGRTTTGRRGSSATRLLPNLKKIRPACPEHGKVDGFFRLAGWGFERNLCDNHGLVKFDVEQNDKLMVSWLLWEKGKTNGNSMWMSMAEMGVPWSAS